MSIQNEINAKNILQNYKLLTWSEREQVPKAQLVPSESSS